MSQRVQDVMTKPVIALPADASVTDAGRAMAENGIGDVVVVDRAGHVSGIVTDRDIVVRAISLGWDPNETDLFEVASTDIEMLMPEDTVEDAADRMRDVAVRRIPVVEPDGSLVGIVSIGDLAIKEDPSSTLGAISAANPNR